MRVPRQIIQDICSFFLTPAQTSDPEGRFLSNTPVLALEVQIKKRRGEEESKEMERQILNDYKGENPQRVANTDAATPRLKHMISSLDKNQGELNNKGWSNYAQH